MYVSETLFVLKIKKLYVRWGSSTVKMATHCHRIYMIFFRVRQFINMISKFVIFFHIKTVIQH
jgi:hypothetical protein